MNTYLDIEDLPNMAGLTRYEGAKQRIENAYCSYDLQEAGINIDSELQRKTEQQVIDLIERAEVQPAIGTKEIVRLLSDDEHELLSCISMASSTSENSFWQGKPGYDESAFNTHDYLNGQPSYTIDKFRYFAQKVADYGRAIALLHAVVSQPEGKQFLREKFVALINRKFRNRALALAEKLSSLNNSDDITETRSTIHKLNVQISHMNVLWRETALG